MPPGRGGIPLPGGGGIPPPGSVGMTNPGGNGINPEPAGGGGNCIRGTAGVVAVAPAAVRTGCWVTGWAPMRSFDASGRKPCCR